MGHFGGGRGGGGSWASCKQSAGSSQQRLGPLGLKLTVTTDFLNSIYSTKSHQSAVAQPQPSSAATVNERMKASNFPISSLEIGSWKIVLMREGHLVAKSYFAKKKLVWEILEGSLKSKIEIRWSDISAIRAVLNENVPGILEIELSQPPTFHDERDPKPGKHTNWIATQDFTGGQALLCRRHCLSFPAGVLDKHYEKLLQFDSRLLELSQQPFPSSKNPFFTHMYQNNYNFADYQPEMVSFFNNPAQQQQEDQQVQAYHHHQQIINHPTFLPSASGSPNSVSFSFPGDQDQGQISKVAPTSSASLVHQNNINNYVDADMLFLDDIYDCDNLWTDCSNQQQYCPDDNHAASMDPLVNLYHHGGNPAASCNIATNNQHVSHEHNRVTTATTAMHNSTLNYQHSDYTTTEPGYYFPPHPIFTVSQPVSVAAPPQNTEEGMGLVNLPPIYYSFEEISDDIATVHGNNIATTSTHLMR